MNVSFTTRHHLCLGCGLCEDICPTDSIEVNIKNGEYRPSVNDTTCLGGKCSKCANICPGLGVDLPGLSDKLHTQIDVKENKYVGKYISLYTGHSTDENIRFHSASGGMITGLLIYLLEKRIIDGAVVTRFSSKDNITPETFIARTKEELISARSSKYCPVSMQGIRKQIRESEGKYIIVGLPCHLHGFRKIEQIDKKFKEHVFAYWGLYCSSGRTFKLTDYVLNRRKILKRHISYFAYRDNGCLGNMVVDWQNNGKNCRLEESFGNYYCTLRSFFIPRRCEFCIDHFAELSDMSFGDIHVKPFSEDRIGVNSVVVRNEKMKKMLTDAKKDNAIEITETDVDVLVSAQQMSKTKKHKYSSIIWMASILGYKIPDYNLKNGKFNIIKTCASYLSITSQRFIGRHQSLWWLIDILKKNNQRNEQ